MITQDYYLDAITIYGEDWDGRQEMICLTYDYAKNSLDENGRKLLGMLDEWRSKRGDIDFVDTERGFNICLSPGGKSVTVLVFWGELNQKESYVMETRQHDYPAFVKMERSDKIRISQMLRDAYFQETSGPYMNVRLEFRQLPMTPERLKMIVNAIDGAVNIVKART